MKKRLAQILLVAMLVNAVIPRGFFIFDNKQVLKQAIIAQSLLCSLLYLPVYPMKTINELYVRPKGLPLPKSQENKENSAQQSQAVFILCTGKANELRIENYAGKSLLPLIGRQVSYRVNKSILANSYRFCFVGIMFLLMMLFIIRPRSCLVVAKAAFLKLLTIFMPGLQVKLGILFYAPFEVAL